MLMWNKFSQEVAGKSQREPGEGLSAQPADKLRDVQSERSILKMRKIGKKLTMRNRISTCSLIQGILKRFQIDKQLSSNCLQCFILCVSNDLVFLLIKIRIEYHASIPPEKLKYLGYGLRNNSGLFFGSMFVGNYFNFLRKIFLKHNTMSVFC